MNFKFLFAALCLCFFFSIQSKATVWYVDSVNTGGFQDGTSWASAYSNPQNAINAAVAGDSVWIAKGTYQPAGGVYYSMKEGVKIFGGFLNTYTSFVQRDVQANVTILKGNSNSVIRNIANNLSNSTILDGVTVSFGNAFSGAGIYDSLASPTINNCTFSKNTAFYGAGIYSISSSPVISNCIFMSDSSRYSISSGGSYGGGLFIKSSPTTNINNCIFSNNYAARGAGIYSDNSSPTINQCTFSGNSGKTNVAVTSAGAGIYIDRGAPVLTQCTFSNNACNSTYINSSGTVSTAISYGGAVCIENNSGINGNVSFSNCTFVNNSCISNAVNTGNNSNSWINNDGYAYSYGGAIYAGDKISINQCSFSGNSCTATSSSLHGIASTYIYGGAVYINDTVSITQSSFLNNNCGSYGGAIYIDTTSRPASLLQNTFSGNTALSAGGGVYNRNYRTTIVECNFNLNTVTAIGSGNGGALCNDFIYTATGVGNINKCLFSANKATMSLGGAIYNYKANSGYQISNCIFAADSAKYGGGICNVSSAPVISNCLFTKNVADTLGAAVYNTVSTPKMINCTLTQNKASANGSAVYNANNTVVSISNTITWGNYSGIYSDATSTANTKYSLVQGYPASATSFLIAGTTNPLFVDTAAGNYKLQASSPCIDMGRNDSIPSGITNDLASGARIYNANVDMGAYEFGSVPLAIGLLYFTGKEQTDNSILLQWQIVNEGNVDFELQHSSNGNLFTTIHSGSTHKESSNTFNYTDAMPEAANYYRLKMADAGGHMEYSNVVFFSRAKPSGALSVYPNPTNNNITLVTEDASLLQTTLVIADAVGKVVKTVKIKDQHQIISFEGLRAGIYFLSTADGRNFKVVKQ